jgi:AcrR family transcriptional regulator
MQSRRPVAEAGATARPARRVVSRDPERTRARIFSAAQKEFSARGMEGARVELIAREAGVNKAMVYHYFGSKEALYVAVLEHAYEKIRRRELELNLNDLDPTLAVKRLAEFTFEYLLENPQWIGLLNDANLHHAHHLKRSGRLEYINTSLTQTVDGVIRRGARSGQFRAGVDPALFYVMLSGMCYFYASNAHTLSLVLGRDLLSKSVRHRYLSLVVQAALGFLCRSPQSPARQQGARRARVK